MPTDLFGNPIVYAKKTNGEEYNIPDDIHQRSSGVNNGEYDSGRLIVARLNVDLIQIAPKTFALNDYRDGRIEITTSAKYNPSLLTPNFNDRINRGYTQSPQDWRNTEAAVEFKIVSGDPNGYLEFWFRTGKDIAGCACEGFAYKAGWRVDGNQQKCTKQMYKGQQYFTTRSRSLGSLIGKWCKLRAACVDLDINGNVTNDRTAAVKCVIQSWMQIEGSDTTYYTQDRIDDGFWGLNGETCQGSQTQVGNWGGPIVALTFQDIDNVHFKSLNVREIDPTIDFPIQPPPTQNPPPVDPPPVEPPPTPPVTGSLDSNGIQWLVATGAQDVVPQSRFNSGDYRWSDNRTNVSQFGYEVTAIVTFDGVTAGDGHMALKHWGPNHSGSCGHTEDGDCCCWYDIGLRDDGEVQLQTERPHPSNHDFTLTLNAVTGPLFMDNIGKGLDGNTIGLKWNIFPVNDGGHADDGGGIHLRMWVDKDALNAQGKPNNNWEKVVDFIDTGQVLGDYIAPSEHDIEMRISDTDEANAYAGGLHFRRMVLGDKAGTTTPPVQCPAGQHLENGVCVPNTTPPPPTQTDPLGVTSSGGFVHDKYGVRMIYKSDTNKVNNYFAPDPDDLLSDQRFDARFTSQTPGSGSGGGGGGTGSDTLIWDSNVDGLWNNGSPRTVDDEEGNQSANGKGLYMAASGDPRLIIDGAGVGTLEADPGHGRFYVKACNFNAMLEGEMRFDDDNVQTTSFKLRSRHQMGGDCENRFGGLGGSFSRTECSFQIESCHNNHLSSHDFELPEEIPIGQWVKFRFLARNVTDNTEILHIMYLDYDNTGLVEVARHTTQARDIEDFFMDRATFLEESEFWMRINNDSDEGSVSYKNVKLWELSESSATLPPTTTPPATLPPNQDGTYRVLPGEAFLTVYPDSTSKQEDLTNSTRVGRYSYNYNTLHQRKTWDDLNTDFRNVESKIYFKALEPNAPSPQDFAIVIGSVNHESGYQNGCGGSSYHGCIDVLTGKFFFVKEQYHGREIATELSVAGIGNIFNKLIGFCFVVAHFDTEDRTHLEIWTDVNGNNTWTKQFQWDDTNNWGANMIDCNALLPGARVSWGSPKVLFEPPEQNVDIKFLSVREIQPGQLLTSTSTGGGGSGGGGSGSVSRIFNHWDFLYNTLVDVSGFVCTGQEIAPGIPYELVYNVTTATNDMELSANWADEDDRIRVALQINSLTSQMINVLPRQIGVWLKKVGLPTGTIHVQCWDAPSDIKILGNIKVTYGTIDAATLPTEYPDTANPQTFTNDLATVLIPNGMQYKWKIGVYFESTFSDDENYVAIAVNYNNPFDSTNTDMVEWARHTEGHMRWNTFTGRDICAKIWF